MAGKKKSLNYVYVPGLISLFFVAFAFTPFMKPLDRGLYDIYLHLRHPIPESPKITLLDVDDLAIDNLGAWPWPRNLMADGLVSLREFGAKYAVFDIEYINKSPPGVDKYYLENGLKRDFDLKFNDLSSNISDLFTGISNKSISLRDAAGYANDLVSMTKDASGDLYQKANQVAINNDLYLGQSMKFFGGAFITLNRQEIKQPTISDKLRQIAQTNFSQNFLGSERRPTPYKDLLIPLEELAIRAKGAGLTNVEIDSDGKRRRIRLFEQVDGKYYAQLVFSPLLDFLGNPKVTIAPNNVHLEGAKYPDGTVKNVDIPLDENGMMLINWGPNRFENSFHHISFYQMVLFQQKESALVDYLSQLSQRDAWKIYSGDNLAQKLVDAYADLSKQKRVALDSGKEEDIQAFLDQKKAWFAELNGFLAGGSETDLAALLKKAADGTKDLNSRALIKTEADTVQSIYDQTRKSWNLFETDRNFLKKNLEGTLCVIGWTGIGTTDIGVNPFQKDYVNVGTHASVANTILQQSFFTETPQWFSIVLTLVFSLGLVFFIRDLSPLRQNLAGLGFVVLLLAVGVILFLVTGIYFQMLAPLLSTFLSFVVFSLVRFFGSEQEKNFLRKAFSTYLSGDVIDEIVTDPGKLKLGGDQKWMTAMFTDVKGFSTISENLKATELVHLLNEYLSGMSDIILNEKGTIDKYEGDAIIAFFGAPLDIPDHAAKACLSAIRMRQLEDALNVKFLEEKMSPVPLLTRIGINTGDMVVGNMGTERKMNYTIMGNTVNLAARLEGVNKQYGTWILTTDFTRKDAGEDFLYRRLDRVRVVGINTPVQLHEVLGVKSEQPADLPGIVDHFHTGLDHFEKREWKKADAVFQEILAQRPDDGPAKTYSKRSKDFLVKPPLDSWDGVFNLTEK